MLRVFFDELGGRVYYQSNTHPVGQKKPNGWGLYDMHGNVWEWCQNRYGNYPGGSVTDPQGPATGFSRVVRGGETDSDATKNCRSAFRNAAAPGDRGRLYGFRPVLAPTTNP